jgi:hypothetical protein
MIKEIIHSFNFSSFSQQTSAAWIAIQDTLPFVKKYKLWRGLFEHRWIAVISVTIAALFSYYVLSSWGLFEGELIPSEVARASLGSDYEEISKTVKSVGKNAASSSGSTYLLFILLEVVIFYFTTKTFSILVHKKFNPKIKDFIRAEKRMIIVMFRNFGKGLLVHAIVYFILAILDLEAIVPFLMFFVYSYFLGYAFLDNYNEQFDKTITESQRIVRQHVWASTTFGILGSGLLLIPLIGPLMTPILGAIGATLYGQKNGIEGRPDLPT